MHIKSDNSNTLRTIKQVFHDELVWAILHLKQVIEEVPLEFLILILILLRVTGAVPG